MLLEEPKVHWPFTDSTCLMTASLSIQTTRHIRFHQICIKYEFGCLTFTHTQIDCEFKTNSAWSRRLCCKQRRSRGLSIIMQDNGKDMQIRSIFNLCACTACGGDLHTDIPATAGSHWRPVFFFYWQLFTMPTAYPNINR